MASRAPTLWVGTALALASAATCGQAQSGVSHLDQHKDVGSPNHVTWRSGFRGDSVGTDASVKRDSGRRIPQGTRRHV